MKQAFKEAYERELALLRERAEVFANDFPGLAERLGGLMEENLDPSIAGLLEGSAFLAARVQLNIDQQFRTFSKELLNQICPDVTAPLPSAMLVQVKAPEKPADLAKGRHFKVNDYLEASFSDASRRVTCRFRLTEPVSIWPVKIKEAVYHGSATPISALGCDDLINRGEQLEKTAAGLVVTLAHTDRKPLSTLQAPELKLHMTGKEREAIGLYEQIFSNTTRLSLRWQDKHGDPVLRRVPLKAIEQVGFDYEHPLFDRDERLFPGVSKLVEYFTFPRKFLGLRLAGLRDHLAGISANEVQVVFEFAKVNKNLASHFEADQLQLFCAPAVNLFEDNAKPITLDHRNHRLAVTPNRAPITNFEVQRIVEVQAQYDKDRDKVPVRPLYALPAGTQDPRQTLFYTDERERRKLSPNERRAGGTRYRYEGTDSFITLYEPADRESARHVYVKTLCSNRHLPEILPMAEAAYHLLEDRGVTFKCLSGPTPPREAMAELEMEGPHRMRSGDNYWRLISLLSLSYRGFLGPDGGGNVDALREALRLFSDPTKKANEIHINALLSMKVNPVTRTLRRPDGFHPARGLEITLEFDDEALDAGGIVAFSAVIERFLSDYAAINSFTECVVKTQKGIELKRWPARGGTGQLL